MGREHRPRAGALQRSFEAQAMVVDELSDAFETQEARVTLVGVEHLRRRGAGDAAVGTDRAHAADAQEQLLPQPVFAAAAVQPVGDRSEEHTSELQSRENLVCRLLLEKK